MKPATWTIALIIILLILGGGFYWYSHRAGPSAATPAQGDGTSVGQNLILGLSSTAAVGQYLSAYNGMTLYTYAPDTAGVSNCTGACAAAWPPYTVPSASAINVASYITGQVGTLTRADGTLQVTYNGRPLYFYAQDKTPEDTLGQGIAGVWFAAKL